jgi:hypothetical protein
MAVITLSQALDRATAGEPIAPNATLAASMCLATNTLARQAALREAKRQLQAQGLRVSQFSQRAARWEVEGFFGKRGGIRRRS